MIGSCDLHRYYTSPKSYTDLISLYTSLLAEKRTEYGEARDRLLNGLNKLQETNAVVDTMQAQLNQLQPVLEEKTQVGNANGQCSLQPCVPKAAMLPNTNHAEWTCIIQCKTNKETGNNANVSCPKFKSHNAFGRHCKAWYAAALQL